MYHFLSIYATDNIHISYITLYCEILFTLKSCLWQVGWKLEAWRPILRPYLHAVFVRADGKKINVTQMTTISARSFKFVIVW